MTWKVRDVTFEEASSGDIRDGKVLRSKVLIQNATMSNPDRHSDRNMKDERNIVDSKGNVITGHNEHEAVASYYLGKWKYS